MKEVMIPAKRTDLINKVVENSESDTVIIVPNWTIKGLVLLVADRMGKYVKVEIDRMS